MQIDLNSMGRVPKRLVLSYIIDWIVIIAIAAVGAGFSTISPNRRPFAITDPNISFPNKTETISTAVLVVAGLIAPAVIIFLMCMFIGLGPKTDKPASRTKLLKRKLWEWNAGWMGLGLSLAVSFLITNGIKNVIGKPRPDLLAQCNPDLSKTLSSTVGGIGDQVNEGIQLVSWTICRDTTELDDIFRSFPSGHSSFSFAGLTYLALFICAKWAIAIPFLNYESFSPSSRRAVSLRKQAAAPPTYLIVFPLIPIGVALYISSTRYSDFRHFGWDITAGAALGVVSAYLAFRMYHLPISRGGGWAWVPRSPDRAFGRGIGLVGYVNPELNAKRDLERGYVADGVGNGRGQKFEGDGIEMGNLGNGQGMTSLSESSQRPLHTV